MRKRLPTTRWGKWDNPGDCPFCRQGNILGTLLPTGKHYQYRGYIPKDASQVWEWKCSTKDCMYNDLYAIGRKKSGKAHTDPAYAQPADTRGLPAGPGE